MLSKVNRKLIFLIGVLIFANSLYSQNIYNLGGGHRNGNSSNSTNIDNNGNVYITGYIISINNNYDFCTIKYNSDGVMLWVKTYNGPGNSDDKAYAITLDKLRNVYVTGYTTTAAGVHNITTIKYNTNGDLQWVARYNSSGNSEATSIIVDDKSNVYVAGFTTNSSSGIDMCAIKYNSKGNQIWVNAYDGGINGEDKAYAITIDKSNNIYITGYSTNSNNSPTISTDYTTIRYSSNGDRNWVKKYNGTGNGDDKAYAITIDKFGYIYITGSSMAVNGNPYIATIKYTSSGTQNWVKTYNGSNNQGYGSGGNAIISGNDDYFYVTGWNNHSLNSNADFVTLKYNLDGDLQWASLFNGTANNDDIAKSLTLDNKDNIYVTGSSKQSGPYGTFFHYATVKYDHSGNQQWVKTYTYNSYEDVSNAISINNQGSVIITGSSMRNPANSDFATIEYSKTGTQEWVARYSNGFGYPNVIEPEQTGVKLNSENITGSEINLDKQIPAEFELSQNYPNPFNPTTKINYAIPKDATVEVRVFDILGKEVSTLLNEFKQAGNYSIEFDGANFKSGVYFYKFNSGNYTAVKKMMLVK